MRVDFTITRVNVPDERIEENIAHARALGLPGVSRRVLNVVGRGPSVVDHISFLRGSKNNLACGTAWAWCRDNCIDAEMMMVDATPRLAEPQYVAGVKRAIVASQCDPAMFAALEGADVRMIDEENSNLGSTAAVVATVLGITYLGFVDVNLFGCEGCYAQTTHANEDIPQPYEMYVRANGRVFRTNTQMLIQSEELQRIIAMCPPGKIADRSGGLLGALIASRGEWELVRWDNAPANVRELFEHEQRNTGNPGWGDDGVADAAAFQARAAQ